MLHLHQNKMVAIPKLNTKKHLGTLQLTTSQPSCDSFMMVLCVAVHFDMWSPYLVEESSFMLMITINSCCYITETLLLEILEELVPQERLTLQKTILLARKIVHFTVLFLWERLNCTNISSQPYNQLKRHLWGCCRFIYIRHPPFAQKNFASNIVDTSSYREFEYMFDSCQN